MKKLKGMKKSFSSLENRKLINLGTIQGGQSNRSAPSNAVGQDCSDTDYYTDDASGNWQYKARLIACGPY
ncbi:grasp-with-spasm system A modified peptide [Chryseobacterium shandongense]|uniref:Grasp-with-spasm system A modified peptide n=1 Tax=Chryseobacterium shandongense TaxID=1493872 RepID=A0AAD1DL23_9FLAO|nr:grasp-with-spasm system A modified peptide [Chryseobacterium shandongense]AZA86942.1 grasp-with-spasm system A modified peptide [Chryseobacterium shandongense]AZA95368.1 grasp-with-spasm system A modified peptide [Chryseobacterium shandongense]